MSTSSTPHPRATLNTGAIAESCFLMTRNTSPSAISTCTDTRQKNHSSRLRGSVNIWSVSCWASWIDAGVFCVMEMIHLLKTLSTRLTLLCLLCTKIDDKGMLGFGERLRTKEQAKSGVSRTQNNGTFRTLC